MGELIETAANGESLITLRVGCEFNFESDYPVPTVMMVAARPESVTRIVHESRWLDPPCDLQEYEDSFGNRCWRLILPNGPQTLRYDAVVEVTSARDLVVHGAQLTPIEDLPNEALVFTLPSRFVESDLLQNEAWELFGQTPSTWGRVQAISDWVHANVTYTSGAGGPSYTATDVYRERVGVCRDFALLSVAFCRALNIPARYTFGYLPDDVSILLDSPMDFHAWFEAYIEGRWYTFDARHNIPMGGRVVIGRGRDPVDVALSTHYGGTRLNQMTVWADVVEGSVEAPGDADADALELAERGGSGTLP